LNSFEKLGWLRSGEIHEFISQKTLSCSDGNFFSLNKAGDKKHALNSSHAIHTLLTKLHIIAKETLHEINSTMV